MYKNIEDQFTRLYNEISSYSNSINIILSYPDCKLPANKMLLYKQVLVDHLEEKYKDFNWLIYESNINMPSIQTQKHHINLLQASHNNIKYWETFEESFPKFISSIAEDKIDVLYIYESEIFEVDYETIRYKMKKDGVIIKKNVNIGLDANISNVKKTDAVVTITFGDVSENHVHNQQIGTISETGFSIKELEDANNKFRKFGYETELINLNEVLPETVTSENASILIIRNGVNALLDNSKYTTEFLLNEQLSLKWDKKAFMRGSVKNKIARYNLCFSNFSQTPNYQDKMGTVISWESVPGLAHIHSKLSDFFGSSAENLNAEGNYYYDQSICGIGFHGDAERRKVIALRLGGSIPLHYQWYTRSKPIGDGVMRILNHGDLYIMSEKAVGYDWMSPSKVTLRHAAGCVKYTTIKSNDANTKSKNPKSKNPKSKNPKSKSKNPKSKNTKSLQEKLTGNFFKG